MTFHLLADGTPLYFEDTGPRDADAILFVPGWTFTTNVWRKQTAPISHRFRVVSCDLRGAGRSGKTLARHSLSEYAEDIAELLAGLGIRSCTVVGWAMGASVAAHLATSRHRRLVEKFVWVDHSPCFFAVPGWDFSLYGNLSPEAISATVSMLYVDRPGVVNGLLDDIFTEGLDLADRAAFYAESFQTPTETAAKMLMLVAQADLRPILPAIDCPVLVVNGAKSVVPPGVGAWMVQQLPIGRAVVLDGAGHAPFWDADLAFNSAVQAFHAD